MKLREHEMICPHLKMGETAVRFRALLWQSPLSINILLHVQCPPRPRVFLCQVFGWLCWKSMVTGLVARVYWQLCSLVEIPCTLADSMHSCTHGISWRFHVTLLLPGLHIHYRSGNP